jgi:hypothetical protein
MAQCRGIKRDGGQCTATVDPPQAYCWWHDADNAERRSRAASKGGKGNRSKLSRDLHRLLEDLTERVVSGDLEPYPASVAGQLVGVRLRLLEYERKIREQDELEERLAHLEAQKFTLEGRHG